ncbi:MAG: preprotein translocase subunit SecY [Candidatus Magasanikbacteria bacterium]|nr:preprotein translocase subunit SecY [Candidatus Magasanikbacteria bacterium]
MWWEKIIRIWKIKDIRKNVLFVLAMLVVFRLAAHIPVPGINVENLGRFLDGNQIFGMMNLFSGGTMENFSIVMLGIAPYITSSIIFQLLGMIYPKIEEMQKEGEAGQQKISMYTRLATVPLAFLQSYAMINILRQSQYDIVGDITVFQLSSIMITITAGTMFLMWIGELISEKKVGNGISLLIFAGIISAVPGVLQNLIINYNSADLFTYVLFAIVSVITIIAVVIISEGQRNIPVKYARQIRGRAGQGQQTHLPLRVNMAGVIPIIFAISVVLFPPLVAQFFVSNPGVLGTVARVTVDIFNNQIIYGVLYFLMVFGFTYFYTEVIFHPDQMAENLQRQGAFIPGIRPGKETENYLKSTMNKIVLFGALFLAGIAILPLIVQGITQTQSLAIGGTSLLIVVSVAIDTAKQTEAQITMHEYDRV